jgi:shikimate dehydrogenase
LGTILITSNGGAAKSVYFALKGIDVEIVDIEGRSKKKAYEKFPKKIS